MDRIVLGKVGEVDLVKLVQKVYELSKPQGMGFLHFKSGGLSDQEAQRIVDDNKRSDGKVDLYLDYVAGRACKFSVQQKGDDIVIQSPWYDHTDEQLQLLCEAFGVNSEVKNTDHGCACNCAECRVKRGQDPKKDDVTGLNIP